jgi:hypothetical protein
VTGKPAAAQHLRDLARVRRVRDRIEDDGAMWPTSLPKIGALVRKAVR